MINSTRIKCFLLTILVIVNTFASASDGKDCLYGIYENFKTLGEFDIKDVKNPLFSLGTNINDFGNYDQCLNNKENSYLLLKVITDQAGQKLPFYLGMCVTTSYCDNESTKNQMIALASKGTGVPTSNISIIYPEKINKEFSTADGFTYVVIAFLLFYVFILSTGFLEFILGYFAYMCCTKKPKKVIKKKEQPKISYANLNAEENIKRPNILNINEAEVTDNDSKMSPSSPTNQLKHDHEEENDEDHDGLAYSYKNEEPDFKIKFPLLSIFNYTKNFNKLFSGRESKDDTEMRLLDGVRVITCFYIILAHSFVFLGDTPLRNNEGIIEWIKLFPSQMVANCSFIVDSFLGLSGFFLSYIGLKKFLHKESSVMIVLKGILYRFLRIWPLYVVVFLIVWKIIPLIGDGPFFGLIFNNEINSCYKQWPFILLMIENYTYGRFEEVSPVCVGWYWYIPIDFQLYIVGIILIVLYERNKSFYYMAFAVLVAVTLALEVWTLIDLDYGVNPLEQGSILSNFKDYYILIYNRCFPFWIGFVCGILYLQYKKQIKTEESHNYSKFTKFLEFLKNNKFVAVSLFWFCIGVLTFIVFIIYDSYTHTWPGLLRFFYLFLSRKVFVLALFMTFFIMFMGHLEGLSSFLSNEIFLNLTKLSYAIYLCHPMIIKLCYYSFRQAFYFNAGFIFVYSIAFMLMGTVLALFLSVLFEMPFMNIKNAPRKKSISEKIIEKKERLNLLN